MFTKDSIIDMFTKNNGINFTINTSESVGLGINGTEYTSFTGFSETEDSNSCCRRTYIDTSIIEEVTDTYIVIKTSHKDDDIISRVYVPYDIITSIVFFANDHEYTYCKEPMKIAKNKLFSKTKTKK